MTYEEALRLIHLPKWVMDENGEKIESITMEQKFPMQFRLHLMSEEDYAREYLLDVKQSEKMGIRLNFQLMDKSNWGLARLDYNSNHKNPEEVNDKVPEIFLPHVGELFMQRSHLHFHIEGFPPLAWALPLEETQIVTKEVTNDRTANDFIDAFNSFASYLNVQTLITINPIVL